jgi:hypothetical protein
MLVVFKCSSCFGCSWRILILFLSLSLSLIGILGHQSDIITDAGGGDSSSREKNTTPIIVVCEREALNADDVFVVGPGTSLASHYDKLELRNNNATT